MRRSDERRQWEHTDEEEALHGLKMTADSDMPPSLIRFVTAVQNVVNRISNVGTAFPGLAICGVCRRGHDRGEGIYPHDSKCPVDSLEKALAEFGKEGPT